MNAEHYFREMLQHFPELEEEIVGLTKDNIHYNMERFAHYTIDRIKVNNIELVKLCFFFQEKNIPLMNSALINALTVSYCEPILTSGIKDRMPELLSYMGPHLRSIFSDYEKYLTRLKKSE